MRRISLKVRLTLWYTVLMVVVAAIVLTFVTSFSQNMINRNYEERLVNAVNEMSMQMRGRPDDIGRTGNNREPRNNDKPLNDREPPNNGEPRDGGGM